MKKIQQLTINNHSFTLLEILIISAIIVLLSGTVLSNYNNFNQEKNLEREANKLVDVLSLAKSKAQAADIDYDCSLSGTDEFSGYSVNVDNSSFSFQQCCRDTTSKNQTTCGDLLGNYNFAANIANSSGANSVNFYPLAEGADAINLILENTLIHKCLNIDILQNGLITTSNIYQC